MVFYVESLGVLPVIAMDTVRVGVAISQENVHRKNSIQGSRKDRFYLPIV